MNQAINAYYAITASSEFREIERLREKARHDEAQALYHARNEGRAEGKIEGKQEGIAERNIEIVRNLLAMDMPLNQIVKVTGLTQKEIEALR